MNFSICWSHDFILATYKHASNLCKNKLQINVILVCKASSMVYKRNACLGCSVYSLAIFMRNNTHELVWTSSQSRCITFIFLLALKWGMFLIFPEEWWEQMIFTTIQPYGRLAFCCFQFALLPYHSIMLCSFASSLPQQQINYLIPNLISW